MAHQEPTRKHNGGGPRPTREIPDKLYFRIGEVAELCDVPAYVLRFWETEFPQFKPNKGGTGQRLFRRRDVEMALRIKTLLYDEGYTIAGARQAFKSELRASKDPQLGLQGVPQPGSKSSSQPASPSIDASHLQAIQKELRDLHALLSRPARPAPQTVQPIRPQRLAPAPKPLTAVTPFPRPQLLDRRKAPNLTDSLFNDLLPDA
jgi:DNA-binding transcriptional MerR regulator